ncbi:transcription-repair coupling factor [Catenovulum sp. SM1970]|uniref:transcription-repair coupling factor n=1 Tax=Marinifaba aquimaris TaxID=2741323 RepID=UPI0015716D23|nr:transcription-repair coupling factor [Marinifaba aquimaris]NTS76102.1 transcription-repair coupling factor [Marinifaba aquimaris]
MSKISVTQPSSPKKAGDHIRWGNLAGSSLSIATHALANQNKGAILVITADTPSALKLVAELEALTKDDKKLNTYYFPDWETLPYDNFSPHQDIISQRLETLAKLQANERAIFVVPATTALVKLAPIDFLNHYTLLINKGQTLDINEFRLRLERAGYRAVDQVMEHGEFALRGSILDLYPMGSHTPFRLDFFDDEIDSIRQFDPENQRSAETLDKIELLPAHEFPIDDKAIETFRVNYREYFEPNTNKESVYYQVSKGIMPAGIEYYLPLFFQQTATLFDYLPGNANVLFEDGIQNQVERFLTEVENRYEDRRYDKNRPLLKPADLYLKLDQFYQALNQFGRIEFGKAKLEEKAGRFNFDCQALPNIAVNAQLKEPFKAFNEFVANFDGQVLILSETQGRRETLLEMLKKAGIKPKSLDNLTQFLKKPVDLALCILELEYGFIGNINDQQLALVTEAELLGNPVKQARRRRGKKDEVSTTDSVIKNLAELSIGQPVVHLDHGVGRYQGLQTLDAGGMPTEFLTLEYADSKLYVPVANLHLISRYLGGDIDHAPLHKLSSDAWEKAKKKAAEKVRDVAAELLDVYAKRESKPGFAFKINNDDYAQFSAGFKFEETLDQEQAINAVLRDMQSSQCMDRLVCGDVGFGKTEVAMRAAFAAVNESKQVAVLVPTTLLAQQHYENFQDRFADWPIKVEVLSRFKTAKQQKEVLNQLAEGQVDVIIGTHKLLSSDVKYQDLGLLIVDEEHRFGVRQKELIKKQRADVDILTLTATPIPRTLNMAMSGMRDLSIIATPPAKRLAVKTFVRQFDKALIKEAISREIMRGGQVYFLHNSVETIDKTAELIQEIVPEARPIIGHGQMRERELERVMSDFYHQKYNVLVCTTIIETGIDVPSANTIIIDQADHFGLAQLHQLRGRVGRSHHQAYAYMLTPHPKRMTKDAQKRLEAIANLEDLGAGFALATHDLEIRGAGELLGDDQSGQITSIGFTLYMEMLEQAVKALKEGREPALTDAFAVSTELELRIPALLPDDYIPDVNTRLSMYKKIASCDTQDKLDDVQIELIDRFGLLPQPAKNLVKQSQLKLQAAKLGIKKLDAGIKGGIVEFKEGAVTDPTKIINLIQSAPTTFGLAGQDKLRFNLEAAEAQEKLDFIEQLFKLLS